jgi:hypothetical protein
MADRSIAQSNIISSSSNIHTNGGLKDRKKQEPSSANPSSSNELYK